MGVSFQEGSGSWELEPKQQQGLGAGGVTAGTGAGVDFFPSALV